MKPLSDQERKVLHLMACGYTIGQIARLLRISYYTAEDYRRRAFEKLGAVSAPHAVALGIKTAQLRTEEICPFPLAPVFRG